jgi:holo-[acyl-carrier protein] synthase
VKRFYHHPWLESKHLCSHNDSTRHRLTLLAVHRAPDKGPEPVFVPKLKKMVKMMSMNLRTGIDLLEIARLQEAFDKHGDRFRQRVFTERELAEVGDRIDSLAARWAAKEAVAKAFGTGIGDVQWKDIEILRGPNREPILYLHGAAKTLAEQEGLTAWSISLSHTKVYAVAMAVAMGD